MQISQLFMNGDLKGAIAYMRDHEEFKDILPVLHVHTKQTEEKYGKQIASAAR